MRITLYCNVLDGMQINHYKYDIVKKKTSATCLLLLEIGYNLSIILTTRSSTI